MPATLADIQAKYGDSVYPLYKEQAHEPYMETSSGNGVAGEVLYDELADKVLCNECDKWFESVQSHVKSHKLTPTAYKEKYGILKKVALCSIKLSMIRSKTLMERIDKGVFRRGRFPHLQKDFNRKVLSGVQKIGYKNTKGLCDAQIAARLIICRDMAGAKSIESKDVSKHDPRLYAVLVRRYGSVVLACKALGIVFSGAGCSSMRYEDSEIIAILRNWVTRNKRIPNWKEYQSSSQGLPSFKVMANHFGSWRRIKMMAGLDQLLMEVKI